MMVRSAVRLACGRCFYGMAGDGGEDPLEAEHEEECGNEDEPQGGRIAQSVYRVWQDVEQCSGEEDANSKRDKVRQAAVQQAMACAEPQGRRDGENLNG